MPRSRTPDSPGDHADLARLIAARSNRLRVARVSAEQTTNLYGERRWNGRTMPTRPYAVYLTHDDGSYGTLAFDLDAKPGKNPAADAVRLGALLTAAGIEFVEAISGPADGRHLIATFRDALPADQVRALAKRLRGHAPSLDLPPLCNPRTGAIRPPGSPHRAGGASTLITPVATARRILRAGNPRSAFDTLYALAGTPPATARRAIPAPRRAPRPLTARIQLLERLGDTDGQYADRSSVAAAICLGYVNAGRPYEEFEQAALDPSRRGLDHLRRERAGHGSFRQRRTPEIRAAAARMWDRRVAYAQQHPPKNPAAPDPTIEREVAAVFAVMRANPSRWGGQAGPSDHAVLCAVLANVLRCGTLAVACGVRPLAERAGIERASVSRALKRLARDGWLVAVTTAAGTQAATYRPAIPAALAASGHPGPSGDDTTPGTGAGGSLDPAPPTYDLLRTSLTVRAHDAMCSDGLGRYAAAVLVALLDRPGTVPDIAARTGLARRTVHRHLRRLTAHGLTHATRHTWHAHDPSALDHAAHHLGVTGVTARRAAAHACERDAYHWYLADFHTRRGWTAERGLCQPGWHTLCGGDRRSVPSVPYPRRDGRADPTRALALVTADQGPAPESVTRALPPFTAPAAHRYHSNKTNREVH